jgi:hypothetical protein
MLCFSGSDQQVAMPPGDIKTPDKLIQPTKTKPRVDKPIPSDHHQQTRHRHDHRDLVSHPYLGWPPQHQRSQHDQ